MADDDVRAPVVVMPMSCFATEAEIDAARKWCDMVWERHEVAVVLSVVPPTYRMDADDPLANNGLTCACWCRRVSAQLHVLHALEQKAEAIVRFADAKAAPDVHAAEAALAALGIPAFGQGYFLACLERIRERGEKAPKAMDALSHARLFARKPGMSAEGFLQADTVQSQLIRWFGLEAIDRMFPEGAKARDEEGGSDVR